MEAVRSAQHAINNMTAQTFVKVIINVCKKIFVRFRCFENLKFGSAPGPGLGKKISNHPGI